MVEGKVEGYKATLIFLLKTTPKGFIKRYLKIFNSMQPQKPKF
jgi:hypothetical protein